MYRRFGKRLLDFAGALFLLVATSWLFVIICLAYTFTLRFPILYRQQRLGLHLREFTLLKFRTLDDEANTFALGAFLRRTSLDELPQLFQVLSGTLSLIGPRPLLVEYKGRYSADQLRRHDVRPGITGWAQVNGRHQITWKEKFDLDVYYVDHLSLALDFRIFIRTLKVLVAPGNDRSLQEQKFMGN